MLTVDKMLYYLATLPNKFVLVIFYVVKFCKCSFIWLALLSKILFFMQDSKTFFIKNLSSIYCTKHNVVLCM